MNASNGLRSQGSLRGEVGSTKETCPPIFNGFGTRKLLDWNLYLTSDFGWTFDKMDGLDRNHVQTCGRGFVGSLTGMGLGPTPFAAVRLVVLAPGVSPGR